MKRLAIAALVAAFAALSFSTAADARGQGYWHQGWHGNQGWHGHHGWYGDRGWHGHYHGWYGGWYPYWGWPNIVLAPGYGYDRYSDGYYDDGYYDDYAACYIKRVRHHDHYGHVYYRRIEVCN